MPDWNNELTGIQMMKLSTNDIDTREVLLFQTQIAWNRRRPIIPVEARLGRRPTGVAHSKITRVRVLSWPLPLLTSLYFWLSRKYCHNLPVTKYCHTKFFLFEGLWSRNFYTRSSSVFDVFCWSLFWKLATNARNLPRMCLLGGLDQNWVLPPPSPKFLGILH